MKFFQAIAMATKKSEKFIMELDIKSMMIFGGLSLVSAALVFYLGMSYGKSSRPLDPGKVVIRSLEKDATEQNDQRDSVFESSNTGRTAESYEKALQKILSEEQKKNNPDAIEQVKADAAPSKPATETTVAEKPKDSSTPAPVSDAEKIYTVQVLASSVYDKANDLSLTLKKKKFEAYIQSMVGETGTIIYRVRVGRLALSEAEKLKEQLEVELKGLSEPRVLPVSN